MINNVYNGFFKNLILLKNFVPYHLNLIKYPDFKDVPWHYANITAGDCLYLPYGRIIC